MASMDVDSTISNDYEEDIAAIFAEEWDDIGKSTNTKSDTQTKTMTSMDVVPPPVVSKEEDDTSMFKPEWDNYTQHHNMRPGEQIVVNDSFLLMEIYRFVPFMKDGYVKFHPLNMPQIRIGRMTIVGLVINTHETATHMEILVDDGTGNLKIRYPLKEFAKQKRLRQEILEKYQGYAKDINNATFDDDAICPKSLPEIRPELTYPPETPIKRIAILEAKWSLDTNNGLLGKKIVPCDYVMAGGYCNLDFKFNNTARSTGKIDFDTLRTSPPFMTALRLDCIEECTYNREIKKWMAVTAPKRYKMV